MNVTSITNNNSSFCTRLQNLYLKKVSNLVSCLVQKNLSFLAGILATFLIEPHNALRAAYLMQRGLNRKKLINLNPKSLSTDQVSCSPVLFVHGDSSNSGLFAPMIEKIVLNSPNKPIFTIDLKSSDGIVSAKNHLNLIKTKINEIAALYPSSKCPKISFVGHSSGGDILVSLIQSMDKQKCQLFGVIIKIGSICNKIETEVFSHYPKDQVVEIVGTKDVLVGTESYLPNKLLVGSAHLGLLFNKTVLKHVAYLIR